MHPQLYSEPLHKLQIRERALSECGRLISQDTSPTDKAQAIEAITYNAELARCYWMIASLKHGGLIFGRN